MTSLVSNKMSDSDVVGRSPTFAYRQYAKVGLRPTRVNLCVYYQTVLSQQVMSPTPPARVIVTVFYQPTLLHVPRADPARGTWGPSHVRIKVLGVFFLDDASLKSSLCILRISYRRRKVNYEINLGGGGGGGGGGGAG